MKGWYNNPNHQICKGQACQQNVRTCLKSSWLVFVAAIIKAFSSTVNGQLAKLRAAARQRSRKMNRQKNIAWETLSGEIWYMHSFSFLIDEYCEKSVIFIWRKVILTLRSGILLFTDFFCVECVFFFFDFPVYCFWYWMVTVYDELISPFTSS